MEIPLELFVGSTARVATINEAGLYRLVIRSTKPEARAFQKWVTGTVLPAICKRGEYMTPEVAKLAE